MVRRLPVRVVICGGYSPRVHVCCSDPGQFFIDFRIQDPSGDIKIRMFNKVRDYLPPDGKFQVGSVVVVRGVKASPISSTGSLRIPRSDLMRRYHS